MREVKRESFLRLRRDFVDPRKQNQSQEIESKQKTTTRRHLTAASFGRMKIFSSLKLVIGPLKDLNDLVAKLVPDDKLDCFG